MITYIEGDLFTSQAQTLVNTVNTVGVMGKGLAQEFKSIYPEMFEEYRRLCEERTFEIGRLLLYRTPHKWVLNFPTKRHWRNPSRLDDIEAGLQTFCRTYAEQGILSAAFPQLGCGNGGLDWETRVRPLMENYLDPLPIDIAIHIPRDEPIEQHVNREQIARWLQGAPATLPYHAFRQDLVAMASIGSARDWTLDETRGALQYAGLGRQIVLGLDDLFDLWRQFRYFGILVPEDVTAALAIPSAEPLFTLLASLPYVARARVVRPSPSVTYDVRTTRAMLAMPEAQGVRLVPPLFLERREPPTSLALEDDAPWSASRTTSQLALFSTS